MKNMLLPGLIFCAALVSCHPSKPNDNLIDPLTVESVQLTGEQADILLNRFEGNMRQWHMLQNDVVTNGDAIINIEVQNSKIAKTIENNLDSLSSDQQQRFKTLREEYKRQTGN